MVIILDRTIVVEIPKEQKTSDQQNQQNRRSLS